MSSAPDVQGQEFLPVHEHTQATKFKCPNFTSIFSFSVLFVTWREGDFALQCKLHKTLVGHNSSTLSQLGQYYKIIIKIE